MRKEPRNSKPRGDWKSAWSDNSLFSLYATRTKPGSQAFPSVRLLPFSIDHQTVSHGWHTLTLYKKHHKRVSPNAIRAKRSEQETCGASDPFSRRSYRAGSCTPFAVAPSDKPSGGTRKLVMGSESTRLSHFHGAHHVGQPLPLSDTFCSSEVDRAL